MSQLQPLERPTLDDGKGVGDDRWRIRLAEKTVLPVVQVDKGWPSSTAVGEDRVIASIQLGPGAPVELLNDRNEVLVIDRTTSGIWLHAGGILTIRLVFETAALRA